MTHTTIKTPDTSVHNVTACALFCQDPRFLRSRIDYLKQEYGIEYGDFDPLAVPGSGKWILDGNADVVLYGAEVAVGLHSGEKVFVFHHMDCGAYGGSTEITKQQPDEAEFQRGQLRQVRTKILDYLSEKKKATPEIILVLEHLGDGEVTYEIVE